MTAANTRILCDGPWRGKKANKKRKRMQTMLRMLRTFHCFFGARNCGEEISPTTSQFVDQCIIGRSYYHSFINTGRIQKLNFLPESFFGILTNWLPLMHVFSLHSQPGY